MIRRAMVAGCAVALLAACGGGSTDEDGDEEGGTPAPSAATTSPTDAATACLAGDTWHLDVGSFASQALSFLQGTKVPATDVDASGNQTIRFTADGLVAMSTDITLKAAVSIRDANGTVTSHRVDEASADWAWVDGTEHVDAESASGQLGFEHWTWLKEDTTSTATFNGTTVPGDDTAYPVYDLSAVGAVTVECSDDRLTLSAESAPFVSHWTR